MVAISAAKKVGVTCHERGTVVVIEGPRFSSAAESTWFTKMGWSVVNMTEYPEVTLAREKEICYCGIAVVTDYDAGLVAEGIVEPVSVNEIINSFQLNINKAKKIILTMIENWPKKTSCKCHSALEGARFS